ncbi:MAG: SBBP repeat-containing protein, partial [Candidatus Kapabacteria bacterium]|nr:SBBP repeat-containing protein [Candidatus Kapabacteria bacterium]
MMQRWAICLLLVVLSPGMWGQPTVEWATYLGATAQDELRASATAFDGSVAVVGWTLGVNFPVHNAWQGANSGGEDAVIAKFDPTGTLLWATYFGGSGNERALGVATDADGNIYLVGVTTSTDLPVANAFQSSKAAGSDAFIAKFSPNGQRIWATYYGGNGDDVATSVVVDAQGMVDITGYTGSTNFPVTANAVQGSLAGYADAFVLQMRLDGMRVWATYFGGAAPDYAYSIAVDARRTIYICGETSSPNFPVRNAFQRTPNGGTEAFVVCFGPFGVWNWSTYYGGADNDRAYAVSVTPDRLVTVVGMTASGDLRITPIWQIQHAGGASDAFVVQLSSAGEFRWAT